MRNECAQRRLSDDISDMEARLQVKAYNQGYTFGLTGQKISQMDWEEEFLPEYNRGYKEGCAARDQH